MRYILMCFMALFIFACSTSKPFVKAVRMDLADETIKRDVENKPAPKVVIQGKNKPKKTESPPKAIIEKANKEAARKPQADAFFNSAMVFDWEPHSLYQVYAAPFRVTDIVMEPSEKIVSISGGDTTRWQVAQTSSGAGASQTQHVIIKPLRANIETNLIVMSDRRTYHLEIHSVDEDYMASVHWNYPKPLLLTMDDAEQDAPMIPNSPAQLDFGYHFVVKTKPAWMPKRVFDDGRKTFIEFSQNISSREMPGLFVLSKTGEAEVINYRASGNFFIIDRLIDIVELRLGQDSPETVGIERL